MTTGTATQAQPACITTDPLTFILAGRAVFTLVSLRTGKRFTYKVVRRADDLWWVRLLSGQSDHYEYIGSILKRSDTYRFRVGDPFKPMADGAKAIEWLIRQLSTSVNPPNCELWHAGRCGRCGRVLTVPESIARGLGPECAGRS